MTASVYAMIEDKGKLGRKVWKRIEALGKEMTRARIAMAAGIDVSTVYKACSGKHEVGVIKFAKLASVIGTTPNDLLEVSAVASTAADEPIPKRYRGYLETLRGLTPEQRQSVLRMAHSLEAANRALEERSGVHPGRKDKSGSTPGPDAGDRGPDRKGTE